jgi:hypothetical protein
LRRSSSWRQGGLLGHAHHQLPERDLHADVFQDVGQLAEQPRYTLQALSQPMMYAVLGRAGVPPVADVHGVADLADALNSPLPLLQTGRLPAMASGLQAGHFIRGDLMADEGRIEELAIFQA